MADINVKEIVKQIKKGELKDMSALVPCFHVGNRTMSLEDRMPFKPLFTLNQPRYMTYMCGRQVSKSYSMCMTNILKPGMVDNLTSVIVEPRYDQKKRINSQILVPLLKGFELYSQIMDPKGAESLEIKKFRNSNDLLLIHAFASVDGARGISGAGSVAFDECLQCDEKILTYDFELNTVKIKKISEVLAKDFLISFKDGAILYSIAERDASCRGVRSCYRITTKTGRTITCTEGHLLPTNIGKIRLGDLVEHVYRNYHKRDVVQTSSGGRLQCGAIECDNGIVDGGRLYEQKWETNMQYALEPRMETARVQFTQVPSITRAYYSGTLQERERRLRGLLVSIDPESFQNIALVVCSYTSDRCYAENNHSGVFGYDRASDSSSLVVHGRWDETDNWKLWEHFDQWLYRRRSYTTSYMDEKLLGYNYNTFKSNTLKYWEDSYNACTTEEGLFDIGGSYFFLYTFLYGIQNKYSYNRMCLLWSYNAESSPSVLLSGMCGSLSKDSEGYILSRTQRTVQREIKTMESSTPCTNKCTCERSLQKSNSRAETAFARLQQKLSREEQRSDERSEACLEGTYEKRSNLLCKATSGEKKTLRESNGGSREESTQECGSESEKSSSICGEPGEGARRAKSVQSEDKGRSRKAQETVGTGSYSCEKTQRTYDAGAEGSRTPEGQRACEGSYGKDQSRSCIIRGAQKKEQRILRQKTGEKEITAIVGDTSDYFYDPIVAIEYIGEDVVYDIEVVGTHNFVMANGICSYNCQDFNPEFIPVIESTMAAHETFGLTSFFGSAKTEDDALGDAFQNSSQGHWCIPCDCGHFNIAAPDQDLHKIIGKEGLICSKCGRHLYTRKGYFVHAYPSRRTYHAGYHVPQIVLPFHCERQHKWADILYEQQKWGQTEFYNEVLGIPVDASTRLLSLKDLLNARNYCDNSLEHAVQVARDYNIIVVGVDWSGGGGGKSRTAIAVLGRRYGSIKTDCLYLRYLRQGMTLDEEANEVAKVVNAVQADYIAHDYTGAGFQREHILYAQHPYLRELNYPVSLAHKPTSQLITYSNNGSRNTYVADRTRCLLMLFTSVKSKQFTVPMFDPKDELAPQLELLNEIEKPQTLESNSNVYLLQKVASKWDDCCFACAIGNLCMCDVTKAYPDFAIDTKYEMSPQQIEAVYGPDNDFMG